jgi:hypothetical protein
MNFDALDPARIPTLAPDELLGMIGWIFERRGHEIAEAVTLDDRHDIILLNPKRQTEYLRFYFKPMPVVAVYALLEDLEGSDYAKVRLYTLDTFTAAQRKVEHDNPLLLEFVDGEALQRRVREAQQISVIRSRPAASRAVPRKRRKKQKHLGLSATEWIIIGGLFVANAIMLGLVAAILLR